jgi:hypothetical protein
MNWDDYIYPVDISYNRQLIYEKIQRIRYWPMYSADRGKTFFSNHRDIYFPIHAEAIRVKNSLIESTTYSFSWVPVGHQTGWHSDANRGCTLILPLDPEPHLIEFEIAQQIHQYYYTGPVLTNAKSWHNGINHSNSNRFNLLFHFDRSYDFMKESAKANTMVTVWQQDYNVCSFVDFKMIAEFYNSHTDIEQANVLLTHDKHQAESFDGFAILLGDQSNRVSSITYMNDTPQTDILDAIEFILNGPGNTIHINLGAL